jgi:hypothetical protein
VITLAHDGSRWVIRKNNLPRWCVQVRERRRWIMR